MIEACHQEMRCLSRAQGNVGRILVDGRRERWLLYTGQMPLFWATLFEGVYRAEERRGRVKVDMRHARAISDCEDVATVRRGARTPFHRLLKCHRRRLGLRTTPPPPR